MGVVKGVAYLPHTQLRYFKFLGKSLQLFLLSWIRTCHISFWMCSVRCWKANWPHSVRHTFSQSSLPASFHSLIVVIFLKWHFTVSICHHPKTSPGALKAYFYFYLQINMTMYINCNWAKTIRQLLLSFCTFKNIITYMKKNNNV